VGLAGSSSLSSLAAGLLAAALAGCASTPPPRPPPPSPPLQQDDDDADPPDDDAHDPPPVPSAAPVVVDSPERSRPPSTASYEQAMAHPEMLDVNDERIHLTDSQLRGPMHGVINGCRVPPNAKITIKTAVQFGRAIGVTVDVRFPHAKPAKQVSPKTAAKLAKAAKREAKAAKKVGTCVDHNVRDIVWPPSNRRDSFVTEF
jgi:hypothetical protein